MEKKAVIISNSLTNDFVSPKEKFLKVDINVGLTEINRLFGEGENYSLGPLPEYLHHAIRGKRDGKPILHILLRDLHDPDDPIQQPELLRFGNHNLMGTEGAAFVDPIQELAGHSEIIDTHALSLPIYDFHRFMDQYLEKDILSLTPDDRTSVYFIITGVYTNVRVFNIAARIRCDYEFPNVFVCPHLVGSKYHQAHLSTLQIGLPNALVHVIPSLQQIYEITGIKRESRTFRQYDCCRIEPESVKRELDHDAKQIIETIFMFNSTVRLKPLSGGFSGGMLFWVEGRKKGAKSEPEVLKIDTHEKMHREIQGYNLVKALLGKTIPSFSQPVFHGKYTGIKMELAAMEGEPDTLQSKFEKIQQIKEFEIFLDPYESIIKKLQTSVYENTTHTTKIYPYKAFGLHTDQQKIWLGENISHILPEADLQSDTFQLSSKVFVKNCISGFDIITKHMDRLNTETSLCHGDLNFANIICDIKKNVWVIDWAYADEMPIEIDFAKMENDIKFVMSKSITEDDLDDLLKLETSMLSSIQLPDIEKLPPALDIFRKDIRYQKIYAAVRLLRDSYLSIKRHQNHILYKISLLKNAAHTLSFDKRRGRGECSLGQLKYALLSTCLLVESIIRDPLHQEIRKESPDEYPQRIPVPKDLASWDFPFPEYDPEYYVDQVVIANDCTRNLKGWADPEALSDAQGLRERRCSTGKLRFDASGKPLNPKGRTGIQGRGLLGKWGPNYAVDPVLTRINPVNGDLEVVLVKRADTGEWGLPGAIMVEDESFMQSAKRALEVKTKIDFDFSRATLLGQMYIDDYRNTDNAWMESYAVHLHLSPKEIKTIKLKEGLGIQDAAWVSITPEVVNRLFANHSEIIKMVLEKLLESGEPVVDHSAVKNILLNI